MPVLTAPSDRLKGALAAGVVQALIGWALITGFIVGRRDDAEEQLKLFDIAEPPSRPKERVIPPKQRSREAEGRAAPPNLRSEATEIVQPPPVSPLPIPPPVVTAPVANPGVQSTQGAADVRGPGQGAGGQGDGFGGGGDGRGRGGGWRDDRDDTPPEHIHGRMSLRDYPEDLWGTGVGGTVGVRYTVETNGRATECRVTRSSGTRRLDDLTCRLIEERFRFDPARDGRGRPVVSTLIERHSWEVEDDPEPPAEERPRRRRWGF